MYRWICCKQLENRDIILALVFVLLGCFASFTCYADSNSTKETFCSGSKSRVGLVCDSNIYDFGEMTTYEAANCVHSFLLHNTSYHIIALLSRSSSCGCSSSEMSRKYVAPSEYVTIDVNANWSSRAGQQEEIITIKTDSAETPEVKLTVRGLVVVRAVLSTSFVDFGKLEPGHKKTYTVKLSQGTDTTPFQVLKVDNPNNYISIKRAQTSGRGEPNLPLIGGPGDFDVTFTAPEYRGQYNSTIVFYTDIEDQPELSVHVEASSVGVFEIKPKMLFFPKYYPEKETLQDVLIDSQAIGTTSVAITSSNHGEAIPFYIKRIHNKTSGSTLTTVVTVGFIPPNMNATVCQATLHVSFGKEVINVPIIAMNKKEAKIKKTVYRK